MGSCCLLSFFLLRLALVLFLEEDNSERGVEGVDVCVRFLGSSGGGGVCVCVCGVNSQEERERKEGLR